jgi:hypothetical protein
MSSKDEFYIEGPHKGLFEWCPDVPNDVIVGDVKIIVPTGILSENFIIGRNINDEISGNDPFRSLVGQYVSITIITFIFPSDAEMGDFDDRVSIYIDVGDNIHYELGSFRYYLKDLEFKVRILGG